MNRENEDRLASDLRLEYLTQLHHGLRQTTRASGRAFIFVIFASLLLVSVSVGLVSIEPELAILGLRIQAPVWIVFVGGSWLVTFLIMYLYALEHHASLIHDQVVDTYEKFDITPVYSHRFTGELIGYPSFSNLVFSRKRFRHTLLSKITQVISSALFLIFLGLIPLVSQVTAGIRLADTTNRPIVAATAVGIACLLTFGYVVTVVGKLRRLGQQREWRRKFYEES